MKDTRNLLKLHVDDLWKGVKKLDKAISQKKINIYMHLSVVEWALVEWLLSLIFLVLNHRLYSV